MQLLIRSWRQRRSLILSICLSFLAGPAVAQWPPAPPLEVAPDEQPGTLPPSVTAALSEPGEWRVTFAFEAPRGTKSVALVGGFNNWNAAETPMGGPDNQGVFRATVTLPSGVHRYKFVIGGSDWVADPRNPDKEPDGFTGFNSVLRLGRLATLSESPGKVGDGQIEAGVILHDSASPLYVQWLAPTRLLLRVRTLNHDIERVDAAIENGPVVAMERALADPVHEYFEASIDLPASAIRGRTRLVSYTFIFTDGDARGSAPQQYSTGFTEALVFKTPDWARDAIWYQIMVDRFRNGDPANDPDPVHPWKSEWFELADYEKARGETFYKFAVFKRLYGGDIAGLRSKLDYLRELGVNALYFNPVFKADSHHKYDATNFLHIDDFFGRRGDYEAVAAKEDLTDPKTWGWTETDRMFLAFLKEAKSKGFRVILDGVFNHVGVPQPAFQDVMKNGKKSKYADWFEIISWEPFKYAGWAGHDSLPVFAKTPDGLASAGAKRHIFDVTQRWMDPDGDGDPSDGIDGWRLDVPNEIPMPFWAEWRAHVRKINPNAYISGEIWDRADQWLDGRHFDAVMNYQFSKPVVAWVFDRKNKITVSEFDQRLAKLRLAYPAAATYVMQNLMNSHDTDRIASMAHNPDRNYDAMNRVQDDNPKYDNSKPSPQAYQRARLAAFLQMTYIGAPMVYYGDEVGMWGADDPTCRKPMLWEDLQPYDKPQENAVMPEQLDHYRKVIALRREHAPLRRGSFRTLLADDQRDVWVFLRSHEGKHVLVAANASDQPAEVQVTLPADLPQNWRVLFGAADAVSAAGGSLRLRVPAIAGIAAGQ